MPSAGDILVVDDDRPIAEFIAEALTEEGYTVRTAMNPKEACAAIVERRPNLVLVDLHLAGKPGDVLVRNLRNDGLIDVPVIMMTADTRAASELSMDGIAFCLMKPFDLDDL